MFATGISGGDGFDVIEVVHRVDTVDENDTWFGVAIGRLHNRIPQGAGLIVRTAGAKRTKTEIKRDYEYLQRLWEQIRELTLKSIAPAKIYEEGDLIKRSIRDLYNREIDEVLVDYFEVQVIKLSIDSDLPLECFIDEAYSSRPSDLEDTVLDLEQRDVERAAAHVIDQDGLAALRGHSRPSCHSSNLS